MFTIVSPVWNRSAAIRSMLDSIIDTTGALVGLIIVDDGSTDDTCAVVEEFAAASGVGERLRLIRQENLGPGAARNRGAREASGEYLAFLDSDDVWFPWTLATYAEAIQKFDSPAFLTGRPVCFSEEKELRDFHECEPQYRVFDDYFSCGEEWLWYGVSSFVIRRDVFEAVGGFAEGRINGEDAELAMRLGTAEGFVHIAEPPLFGYRQHGGNVTLNHEKSLAGVKLLIEGEQKGRFPGGENRAAIRRAIISRHVRPLALTFAQLGRLGTAFELYRATLRDAFAKYRVRYLLGLPLLGIAGWLRNVAFRTAGTR